MAAAPFDRNRPFNDLPPLPLAVDLETPRILKQAIAAHRVLAELKGLAKLIPNQAMLVDGLVLQEARLSSEIENVLTTNDALYRAAADDRPATDPHTNPRCQDRCRLPLGGCVGGWGITDPGLCALRGQPFSRPTGSFPADPGGRGASAPRHDKAADMTTYSSELKDSILTKLLAPNNVGVPQLAAQTGIPRDTLYG
ncbi:Fic/DOC family N-terminal domain-containing protein, partial [Thiocapsa marina]